MVGERDIEMQVQSLRYPNIIHMVRGKIKVLPCVVLSLEDPNNTKLASLSLVYELPYKKTI